jgi:hypothetical protein
MPTFAKSCSIAVLSFFNGLAGRPAQMAQFALPRDFRTLNIEHCNLDI